MSVPHPSPIAGTGTGSAGLPLARAAAAVVALLAGVVVTAIMLTNGIRQPLAVDLILVPLVGWSFAVSGLVAWSIRERNPIGPAMVITGLLWLASGLYWSQDPVVFSFGHAFESFYLAGIVYVLLAFPTGHLDGRVAWLIAVVVFLAAGPAEILFLALGGHAVSSTCAGCPTIVFQVARAGDLARALQAVQHAAGLIALALSVGILVGRWRRATPPLRFAIAPVIWTGMVALPVFALWVINEALGGPIGHLADVALDLTLVAIAGSFLVGVARTRLARSAVADLMLEISDTLEPGALRSALARALRDPSLVIAYWLPEPGALRRSGRPTHRAAWNVRGTRGHDDRARRPPIAALIHDPALDDEHLVRSVCAAAALALENERLQAELRARLAELQASRARLVEATQDGTAADRARPARRDAAAARLDRDDARPGRVEARGGPAGGGARSARGARRAHGALAELRELSQGIRPAILVERGLAAALDDLSRRSRAAGRARRRPRAADCRSRSKAAAYFVVSEALANAAKHSHASEVRASRRSSRRMACSCSRSPTTGSAARPPAAARGCAASPTASRRSAGG